MTNITWRNDVRRLGDLVPWEHNPKRMSKKQADGLRLSIERFGFAVPFLVSEDGNIYDGHQRQTLMNAIKEYGPDATVDVRVSSRPLTDDERRELVVRLKQNQAGWDFDMLPNLYEKEELIEWGFEDIELGMFEEVGGSADAEPQVDRAEELRQKWQVEPGDLWAVGAHRLICGDCTDASVVGRVMGGEKAEMVWTDPPYGVAVGDKNKFLNSIARSNRIEENLQNDTLNEPALLAMLCAAFDNAMAVCTAGAAWYVAAPAGPLHVLFGQALKDRGIWRQTLQWVKNNATFSPMGVCYHWQAEPIFFGWLPNGGHRFYGGRTQTTVWEIDRPSASPEHPTMKPVELIARAIENSSQKGEIALDPFLGSGTTMVACENLGRRCRAVEIAPGYVAVALERMATAFPGIVIERVNYVRS